MTESDRNGLPEWPGVVWLRLAIPVPKEVMGAWADTPAKVRWDLEQEVRQAAVEGLHHAMGRPMASYDVFE